MQVRGWPTAPLGFLRHLWPDRLAHASQSMFESTLFNSDIANWDVSKVTTMKV